MRPTTNTLEQKNRRGDVGPTRRNAISIVRNVAQEGALCKARVAISHTGDGDASIRQYPHTS
jgi:hypothetical protein